MSKWQNAGGGGGLPMIQGGILHAMETGTRHSTTHVGQWLSCRLAS